MAVRRQVHFAERMPLDPGDAIVLSQPLVEDRPVAVDELQQTAVALEYFLKEQVRLPEHGLANQIVVVAVQAHFRGRSKDVTQVEPLTGEIRAECMSTRTIEH